MSAPSDELPLLCSSGYEAGGKSGLHLEKLMANGHRAEIYLKLRIGSLPQRLYDSISRLKRGVGKR